MTPLRLLLLAALALGLSGCAKLPIKRDGAKAGPFFTPVNVTAASPRLPADIRRVLLRPISADGLAIPEENLSRLDAAFLAELNRTARFEVVTLTRDELARITGSRQLNSTSPLPPAFIDRLFNIYNPYAADAVLFVDLTAWSAYPPLAIHFGGDKQRPAFPGKSEEGGRRSIGSVEDQSRRLSAIRPFVKPHCRRAAASVMVLALSRSRCK